MKRREPTWIQSALHVVPLLVILLVAACSTGNDRDEEILVFAASSLTDSFNRLASEFEAAHGVSVLVNFASSSTLATQIAEGAPVDVFASANDTQMQRVIDSGRADEADTFAANRLVVVVPSSGSPVNGFEDLGIPGVKLVLASSEVPVGAYARKFIASYNSAAPGYSESVMANIVSEEPNVRAVLTKVQLGEADAGVVYETDAAIAGDDVRTFEIPGEYNVIATYSIGVITDTETPDRASEFIDFVMSQEGQAILRSFGFSPVPGR